MSNPPNPYNRSYNFEDFQTLNPNSPLPAQHVENELNNIEETLDATVSRLAEIQNADGSIKLTENVEQILLNAATVEATNVANQISADYLAANFDSNAAASASSSANAAAQSALQSEASKVQAGVYSTAAQQYAASSYAHSVNAANSKNAAEDYADSANASKIAAHGYKLSAQNAQSGANSVYQSTLQLKEGLDSDYGQLLYKREDVNHVGANMLFNGGDINNTLIGKIFPGTSFDLNSKLVNNGPINITGLNYINGPWWVEGNAQAENPSDIVTRDMMNCLVQTWKTFGPNVARGELKPLQTGVNGTPNPAWSQTDFPNTTFIKPIVYDETDFNANQSDPVDVQSAALTPKGYVDGKLQDKLTYKNDLIQLNLNTEISFNTGPFDNLSLSWSKGLVFGTYDIYGTNNEIAKVRAGHFSVENPDLQRSIDINSGRIELKNYENGLTKGVELTTENNLLKVSTGIKFPDGTTQTTASLSGSYLQLAGGTMNANANIIFPSDSNGYDSEVGPWGFGVERPSTSKVAYLEPEEIGIYDGTHPQGVRITSSSVTFNDATVQTTAFPGYSGTTSQLIDGTGAYRAIPSLTGYAPLASPTFTGNPTAPTPVTSDNDTSIATTAFVKAQNYITSSALTEYAKTTSSGATFYGKVTLTTNNAEAYYAAFNIPTSGTPITTVNGDIWLGGTSLAFKNGQGDIKTVATVSSSNDFIGTQTIFASSSGYPALSIRQNGNGGGVLVENPNGSGYSFKVTDGYDPDLTPFTIDANGRVGIGVTPDATVALKVDSTGIKFNDGSVQTTAATSQNLSEYAKLSGASFSGTIYTPTIRNLLNTNLVIDAYNDTGAGTHNYFNFNPYGGGLELPTNSSGIKFGDGTIQNTAATAQNLSGYAQLSGATFTGKVFGDRSTTAAGYNIKTGVTPTTTIAGDVWIGSTGIRYADGNNVNRLVADTNRSNTFTTNQFFQATDTNNSVVTVTANGNGGGLKVTNLGTGESLRVEDQASPDATAFVIAASGAVGIGVTPDINVALSIDASGIKINGATLIPASTVTDGTVTSGNMSHSEYPKELIISINGVQYGIPLRVVTPPATPAPTYIRYSSNPKYGGGNGL